MMRWVFYPVAALVALVMIGAATVVAISLLAWPNLPTLEALTDYRPNVPLRVYTADNYLIDEFGEERRSVVKLKAVPDVLIKALLAAEDEHFYAHMGIDPVGLVRAMVTNLRSGRRGQGASTITMQVARNFFLTRERSYNRKLYEVLLSLKIERNLSKDQILELYVNQIFLGQRAYGFSAATQIYFGKQLDKLTLGEAAMLAGLPQAPTRANPITSFARAEQRQHYVLRRMFEAEFITEAEYKQAMTTPVRIARASDTPSPVHAGHIAEIARQIAIESFGDKAYQEGIKIITTITRAEQEAAYHALRQGVMDYDRRHGYRGPEKYLILPADTRDEDAFDEEINKASEDGDLRDYDDLLAAVVLDASPTSVSLYRNGQSFKITGDGLRFAAPALNPKAAQGRRVRRGAVVRIRHNGAKGWELTQLPQVEAALVSVESNTGAVRALVGGFDYGRNKYNNVTQAQRQPGSSFKPFVYSASLERGYSPGSLLADEPLYYPAGGITGQEWTPHNYDGKFSGIITLRNALARSKNIPAIRVLEAITPAYAQDYVSRFGFDKSRHPPYLTMALGAGSVTPWEMASAYAVFANGGYRIHPYVVKEIIDSHGKTIARFDPSVAGSGAPRAIDERNAWIMNSMLLDVVRWGTAASARVLKRNDLAGKTGTTNDYADAWFCGYNPKLVAISWIGFPTPHNLGRGETGGTAALPIWINYMRTALANIPETTLSRPQGITSGVGTDFYYAENPPPMQYIPETEQEQEEDWFTRLFSPPQKIAQPPAPREREREREQRDPHGRAPVREIWLNPF
jgi:penicillin-binding protein 1A